MAQQTPNRVLVGVVREKKKAFGFIKAADLATDVFFHCSACLDTFSSLSVGDAVEFVLAADQHGKQAAARVWPTTDKQPELTHIDQATQYGIVGKYAVAGHNGSGFLRYMGPGGKGCQHLTFKASDLAPGLNAVAAGQVVRFKVLTDRRQQQASSNAASASRHAKHAYLRATQLKVVSPAEEVLLDQAVQQQLVVLEALAATFDTFDEPCQNVVADP